MRFEEHLTEATIPEMAKELVQFQEWIQKEVMDKSKNPEKSRTIIMKAFQNLEKDIKKALRA